MELQNDANDTRIGCNIYNNTSINHKNDGYLNNDFDINCNDVIYKTYIDGTRTIHSIQNTEKFGTESNNYSNTVNIYRYKFTQDFMDVLYEFSKIHQYDDRKSFKEAWQLWVEDNDELVNNEVIRLHNLKYDGDVLDKMFKSARYYFRKKSTVKPEPKIRRQYISIHRDLLDAMDEQITTSECKPSDGFVNFCQINIELLRQEVTRLVVEQDITDVDYIKNKIKKTYKNRYFMNIGKISK